MDFFNLSNSFCKFIYESAFYEDEKIQGKNDLQRKCELLGIEFQGF